MVSLTRLSVWYRPTVCNDLLIGCMPLREVRYCNVYDRYTRSHCYTSVVGSSPCIMTEGSHSHSPKQLASKQMTNISPHPLCPCFGLVSLLSYSLLISVRSVSWKVYSFTVYWNLLSLPQCHVSF